MKKVIDIALCLLPYAAAFAQNASAVIERYLQALGGREKLSGIETRINKAYTVNNKHFDITGLASDTTRFESYYKKTNKFKYSDQNSVLCYDGETFWRKGEDGKIDIMPEDHGKYFQSTISAFGSGSFFLAADAEIKYMGERSVKDEDYYVLSLKRKGWLFAHLHYFDRKSGLLILSHAQDRDPQTGTYYNDYTDIKGVLTPFREEFFRSDKLESYTVFQEVQINEPVEDAVFQVPGL